MNRHGNRVEAQGAKGAEEAAPLTQGLGRPGEIVELDVRGAEGVLAKANHVSCRGRDATGHSSVIAGRVVRCAVGVHEEHCPR